VAYGESDVIATYLTATTGKISMLVRGGRASKKRVQGALEPFHTARVRFLERRDLATFKDAELVVVRTGITAHLDALEAAGQALRWARDLCPPRTPEPAAFATLSELLDALDAKRTESSVPPSVHLVAAGLRLLRDVGYGLDLDACVRCGKPCPEGRSAHVSGRAGGIVCATCGGEGRLVAASALAMAREVLRSGTITPLTPPDLRALVTVVEDALLAHADIGD
jgi:DNA repair protein RecO (recombination protein O)